MKGQWDAIQVGRVILPWFHQRRAWLTPGNQLEPNPLRAQRIAEKENERMKRLYVSGRCRTKNDAPIVREIAAHC